uniref:hypothetical protein n=1 Tax=Massilia sp. TWP1-3-3 TaxID=2804573 RepID=UPI003CE782D6
APIPLAIWYTYPQLLASNAAPAPGSNFNQQGGSIFDQRQHRESYQNAITAQSALCAAQTTLVTASLNQLTMQIGLYTAQCGGCGSGEMRFIQWPSMPRRRLQQEIVVWRRMMRSGSDLCRTSVHGRKQRRPTMAILLSIRGQTNPDIR